MNVKIIFNLILLFFLLILEVLAPEASNPSKPAKFYGVSGNTIVKPVSPPNRTFIVKPK